MQYPAQHVSTTNRHLAGFLAGFLAAVLVLVALPAVAQEATGGAYEKGRQALDGERWRDAALAFTEAAELRGQNADGALYWKAYAHMKLSETAAARAAVNELRRHHPASAWLDDARALELEMRQQAGDAEEVPLTEEEELQLYALQGLLHSNSEKAIGLLERYIGGDRSPKLRERALFVLSQSDSPRAKEVLLEAARGERGREAQLLAVRHLGFVDGLTSDELESIYRETDDLELKQMLLHAFAMREDAARLLKAAREEENIELRRAAVHQLGILGAVDRLEELYSSESDLEIRRAVIHGLAIEGASDRLIALYRQEKNPELRIQIVQSMGLSDSEESRVFLAELYAAESDVEIKRSVIQALGMNDNVSRLIEIAKTEKDAELRREVVRWLGMNGSDEAVAFLMELLEGE